MFVKKILYTVCSANHLAHCKTMADSFIQFNPSYELIIALVDKIDGRFNPDSFLPYSIIEVGDMGITDFEGMTSYYSVIELNCAMKAFAAQYIMHQYSPDLLIYLDSDILVFDHFNVIEQEMLDYQILITPHFTKPYPDANLLPRERDTLRSGIYNAGFFAIKKGEEATSFLNWWAAHMRKECFYNFAEGMGVDQIWFNLVPLLFKQVCIFTDAGANIAYWNLHERQISFVDGRYFVNENRPLLFLHISGYAIDQPESLSRHQNRYNLSELPLLKNILSEYASLVKKNGFQHFHQLPCAYAVKKKQSLGIMKMVNKWIKPLGIKVADI